MKNKKVISYLISQMPFVLLLKCLSFFTSYKKEGINEYATNPQMTKYPLGFITTSSAEYAKIPNLKYLHHPFLPPRNAMDAKNHFLIL